MLRARLAGVAVILSTLMSAYAFELLYPVDGDSVQGKHNQQARLLCIDAPELNQRGGKQSHHTLQQLLRGRINIEKRGTDQHARDLVLLTDAHGKSINMEMVRLGQAWVSRRYASTCGLPTEQLYAAEHIARQSKRGLWKERNPQPPWQWRRENPRD